MLVIYRDGIGKTREELHAAIGQLFWDEVECPPARIKAFCKLLDSQSDFEGSKGGAAPKLRKRVFRLAASKYPLVRQKIALFEHHEDEVKASIASDINRPWLDIEQELFSDVFALQRLRTCTAFTGEALLTRYNEAQLQAVLYDATEMRIVSRRNFKEIVRAAKLAELMFTAVRQNESLEFIFSGPASALRTTTRYGVHMARMIPTLLACEKWEMSATIRRFKRGPQPTLVITSENQYRSSLDALPEFDSKLERSFAEKWGTQPREGWRLERETEPRFVNQKAFFPDFTFKHADGRKVLFEIVGFWTPEYLAAKQETVRQFRYEPLLLAVKENQQHPFIAMEIPTVQFKSALKIETVLSQLRKF
jgi:predicted nuclease of restriction endonuclease-like RecB superfamily